MNHWATRGVSALPPLLNRHLYLALSWVGFRLLIYSLPHIGFGLGRLRGMSYIGARFPPPLMPHHLFDSFSHGIIGAVFGRFLGYGEIGHRFTRVDSSPSTIGTRGVRFPGISLRWRRIRRGRGGSSSILFLSIAALWVFLECDSFLVGAPWRRHTLLRRLGRLA